MCTHHWYKCTSFGYSGQATSENHGERPKFAFERVEGEPERFEGQCAEKVVIALLAEAEWRRPLALSGTPRRAFPTGVTQNIDELKHAQDGGPSSPQCQAFAPRAELRKCCTRRNSRVS
jgi:hypothetical protein